jgi:SAM-dependent methyltransferase
VAASAIEDRNQPDGESPLTNRNAESERPQLTANFYRRVGVQGWRKSSYSTDTWKYPVLRRWIMNQLTKRGRRILSVGCGTGELERGLRELRYRVIGLDFSFEMLQTAARQGDSALVQGDGHLLPFAAGSFDAVILPESLGHLKAAVALEEANRVLRKRGRLLITTYPKHRAVHPLYAKSSLEELTAQVIAAGFRVKEHRLLRPQRAAVEEVRVEKRCALLFVLATRREFGLGSNRGASEGQRAAA